MLADELDYVLGVHTHRDEHVLAVVTAPPALSLRGRRWPRTHAATGSRFALRSGTRPAGAPGRSKVTGSYGAGLARFLAGRGELVLELSRTPRAERRLRGKDDSLDAVRTARAALASDTLALPRGGGATRGVAAVAGRAS